MDELFNAAISGNVSFFEEPTGKDFNLEQVTERGNSILHLAAKSGKVQFMKKVLDLQRSLLLLTNCNDDTALHIAARLGHLDMTELLITCAKDLEAEKKFSLLRMRNSEENTALHEAIRNNYYDIVELLVREDPELVRLGHENEEIQTDRRTKARKDRESPLFLAVDQGFFRIAHHIIDTVQKCSYGGRNNMNVLHAAVLRYQTSKYLQLLHLQK